MRDFELLYSYIEETFSFSKEAPYFFIKNSKKRSDTIWQT